MSRPMHCYRAYGLRIHSDVALPFDPLPDPPASAPDVVVRLGVVPGTLPGGPGNLTRTPFWQARPGAFLMHLEGVVRYRVTGGRYVLIEPLGGDDACIGDVVAGPLFTFVLQQRGVVTLHAAAVAAEVGAVLLCGRSGIGKSSLAAALVERGYPLLSDDVAGVVRDAGGRATAAVGARRGRDALARPGAVEGAAGGEGEVLDTGATGLRRAAAGAGRLRVDGRRPPGRRH